MFVVLYDKWIKLTAQGTAMKFINKTFKGLKGKQRLRFVRDESDGGLQYSWMDSSNIYLVLRVQPFTPWINSSVTYQFLPLINGSIETMYYDI